MPSPKRKASTKQQKFQDPAPRETDMTADSGSDPGDVFDVRKVRKFIELMNEHDLSEIDLRQGDQRIRVRRGPEVVSMSSAPMSAAAPAASSGRSAGGEAKSTEASVDDSKFAIVRSPMVGTFYAAANPESPPFVKVGDQIGPDTTVCIVEAMKVFNEIPAECSGRIVAVLAQSGEPVEFNQPLFRVEPN
jgi:acetyl-CoA carboxylase biotin carboxyl carrier protein